MARCRAGRPPTEGRAHRELHDRLRAIPLWREQENLLRSIPGIGPVLCATLLADVPELGTIGHKELAALIGVAPLNRDSGRWRGKRSIWGGRAYVRAVLYMATTVAVRTNPPLNLRYTNQLANADGTGTAAIRNAPHDLLLAAK